MDIKVLASGSTGNCYRISDGSTALLLDAGIPIREVRKGLDFQLHGIDGVLVTHCHRDHSKAVEDLLRAGIDIYMPAQEIAACGFASHHRLHSLEKQAPDDAGYKLLHIGSFTVLPFRVEHDTPEPVGYLAASSFSGEKLLYFTDTYYLRYRFTGLTHIIGECNYDSDTMWEHIDDGQTPVVAAKRLLTSHMNLETFLGFLDANDLSKLRQIYICHMSDNHGHEEKILKAVRERTGCEVYIC